MKKFALAIMASVRKPDASFLNHVVALTVEAQSYEEAIGKGHRIAQKMYPPSDGWHNHAVDARSADEVYTPESAGWRDGYSPKPKW